MELHPIIVNTDSETSSQLLVGMGSEQAAGNMAFIRREGRKRRVRFATKTGRISPPFTDAQVDHGSVVSMAIGDPDSAPTSGTFGLSYNGSSTGLTGLSASIAAATLQTALNANAAITSAGGVTVAAAGDGAWIVTFVAVGTRFLFTEAANALVPPSLFNSRRIQTGDGSHVEIQLITLRQKYLAFSNDFAPVAGGSISADHIQTGDATKPDIYRIAITGDVDGGTWLLNRSQAQVLRLTPGPNTSNVYQSKYALIYDSNGSVGIWFNVAGGGAIPAQALAADRAIAVTGVTDGMTGAQIVDVLVAVLDADAEFIVTDHASYAELTMAFAGPRTAPSAGNSPMTVAETVAGSTISASFTATAQAGDLQAFVGADYTVTSDIASSWDLVANVNGAGAAITVDGDGLIYADIWEGNFNLSTVNLFLAFAAANSDTISSKFEIQVVEPAGAPCKLYQGDCEIRADVIDADNLSDPSVPNISFGMKFFDNDAARAASVPQVIGQLGFQEDTGKFYIADGTSGGSWGGNFVLAVAVLSANTIEVGNTTTAGTLAIADGLGNGTSLAASAGPHALMLPASNGTLSVEPDYAAPALVTEGDSLTSDQNIVGGLGVTSWPFTISALIPTWSLMDVARGGQSTPSMVVDCPTNAFPYFSPNRSQNVFVAMAGTNDLEAGTAASAIYANLETMAQGARAAGAKTAVVTVIPRGTHSAGAQTQRLALNTLIRTNTNGYFDAIADPCALTQFDAQGDSSNTTYYNADTIHLKQAGQDLLAANIYSAISGLLATPSVTPEPLARSGQNSDITGLNALTKPIFCGDGVEIIFNGYGFKKTALTEGAITDGASGLGLLNMLQLRIQGQDVAYNTGAGVTLKAASYLDSGKIITAAGTTGARTINAFSGTVNFAAAAPSLVVTNSQVTASSIIQATVGTNDTTMKSAVAVAGSGFFTIFPNVNPTAETRVNFTVTN